ncbi:hypothetical protein [Falsibacillus pallidus]|uniref:Uncharacterized protein n=1 Tax=Falsibacillus pallidus TaxID=493781 RepID=A0A370GJZ8_9BACI|nr:hypothetical protein [Falsibacillus pallidus]RDI43957.1 hypothetical protein DFR59_10319 [Falsibacillus pallidus]
MTTARAAACSHQLNMRVYLMEAESGHIYEEAELSDITGMNICMNESFSPDGRMLDISIENNTSELKKGKLLIINEPIDCEKDHVALLPPLHSHSVHFLEGFVYLVDGKMDNGFTRQSTFSWMKERSLPELFTHPAAYQPIVKGEAASVLCFDYSCQGFTRIEGAIWSLMGEEIDDLLKISEGLKIGLAFKIKK